MFDLDLERLEGCPDCGRDELVNDEESGITTCHRCGWTSQ